MHLPFSCSILLTALACVPAPATEDGETGGSGTGDPAACADQLDQASCQAFNGDESGCSWRTLWRAQRSDDSCAIEEVGRCFDDAINDSAAGCGPAAGCEDLSVYIDPFYMVEDGGTVLLLDMCGGTAPSGFEPCPTAEASADDPPECACACALAPMP